MAHDQVEYCGDCEHFSKCLKRAKEGRLIKCKVNDKKNASIIKEPNKLIGWFIFFGMLAIYVWFFIKLSLEIVEKM